MTSGKWSENEPSVAIDSVDDLDCFVDFVESKVKLPTAISVDVHGYRVDLLVGHEKSFVHMSPEDLSHPYHVTIGNQSAGVVDFWLHSAHYTQFENRHLVGKGLAREAFRVFFETGCLSPAVEWEDYFA
jgi:hypothetical protein